MPKLTVNGETRETPAQTLAELLAELGLDGRPVAVELNKNVIPRKQHADTPLQPGDQLELVTLVGGG